MEIGKYLPNVKGMENKVVTGLAGLVALGAIAVMPGDACAGNRAKEYGAGLINSAIHSHVDQTVRNHVNRNRETVVNGVVTDLPDSYLPKEKAFVPNVYSIGDADNDGVEDWRYCKAEGECYRAKKFYKDPADGKYTTDKISSAEWKFGYWDTNDDVRVVPKNVLVKK